MKQTIRFWYWGNTPRKELVRGSLLKYDVWNGKEWRPGTRCLGGAVYWLEEHGYTIDSVVMAQSKNGREGYRALYEVIWVKPDPPEPLWVQERATMSDYLRGAMVMPDHTSVPGLGGVNSQGVPFTQEGEMEVKPHPTIDPSRRHGRYHRC